MIEAEFQIGEKVYIKQKEPIDPLWHDVWLPVRIIRNYRKFYTAEVLPHINPNFSQGMSKPYIISIPKFSLINGEVLYRYNKAS